MIDDPAPSPDDLDPIIVMGVSGSGKSVLARALAERLGRVFVEGDDHHPAANIRKMTAGIPLSDADRRPFLAAVAAAIRAAGPKGAVASCSALKRRYRDLLRDAVGSRILFVLPVVDRDILSARLGRRPGHFMPPALLDSQLADLEPPGPDEAALTVDGTAPVEALAAEVLARLRRSA